MNKMDKMINHRPLTVDPAKRANHHVLSGLQSADVLLRVGPSDTGVDLDTLVPT